MAAGEHRPSIKRAGTTSLVFGPDRRPSKDAVASVMPLQLGICAMEKKTKSKPMLAILNSIQAKGGIDIVEFPQKMILEEPVENWPHHVDVLISFFSDGFPLEKAEAYVALRKPKCINNLTAQRILQDRRKVYDLLVENGIPHPRAIVVERGNDGNLKEGMDFVEEEDFVSLNGQRVDKPFVEKPADAEDHNVWIYYPSAAGGGVKKLFRKVGNQSSAYDAGVGRVRRDGTYMYEAFMKTQGTDIKVYTVGSEYAHAEARKSPVVDGVVKRNKEGKEMRVPIVLTPLEKDMARRVCFAFGQMVCGFDLLRTTQGSFVIDVNGWSFVKGVKKYYQDAAAILRSHMFHICGRADYSIMRQSTISNMHDDDDASEHGDDTALVMEKAPSSRWDHEELLAVLAVLRHADRTPKNKMKLKCKIPEFIALHKKWGKGAKKETKLKTPTQLQEMLDISRQLLTEEQARLEPREIEALTLVRTVLEEGGQFDGIYRKVQLKPLSWNAEDKDKVDSLEVILKYGGVLTAAGIAQAEHLGHKFRREMYPGDTTGVDEGSGIHTSGLLRLHATQRHDFKVYSSEEGRVQMSAAAFARGLLDLEGGVGALTPICAALVEPDSAMLDELPPEAHGLLDEAKRELYENVMGADEEAADSGDAKEDAGGGFPASTKDLEKLNHALHVLVKDLEDVPLDSILRVSCEPADARSTMLDQSTISCEASGANDSGIEAEAPKADDDVVTCCSRFPVLIVKRWQKLRDELWDKKKEIWNISKVPEICDGVKYDLMHHPKLAKSFEDVYNLSTGLNNVMVPSEYGSSTASKVRIGATVCGRLLRKLNQDLNNSVGKGAKQEKLPERPLVTAVQYMKKSLHALPEEEQELPATDEDEESQDEDIQEAEHAGLDFRMSRSMELKSASRRVRTRLYFTSESHIQTLMSVLRFGHLVGGRAVVPQPTQAVGLAPVKEEIGEDGVASISSSQLLAPEAVPEDKGIVCDKAEERLLKSPVFDYLTQIVFRLYEDRLAPTGSEAQYRVEVLFSPGAVGLPKEAWENGHMMRNAELEPLHPAEEPLTLAQLQRLLNRHQKVAASCSEENTNLFRRGSGS